jgi:hypothetical protein
MIDVMGVVIFKFGHDVTCAKTIVDQKSVILETIEFIDTYFDGY